MRFSIQIQTTWEYRIGELARKPHGDPTAGTAIGAANGTVEEVVEDVAVVGGDVEDVLGKVAGNGVVVLLDGADTAPDATVRPSRPPDAEQPAANATTTRTPGNSLRR